MLALISPAKTLDYETALPTDTYTQPRLLQQSQQLIDVCRKLSATEIASLMTVSEKIANLNLNHGSFPWFFSFFEIFLRI